MTTVSLPKEIAALFADTHDDFPAIIGKPSDNDTHCLRRCNFQALQYIDLGDGTNTTGLIISKIDHKAANENQMFDLADGALETYDPSIQDNENNAVRLRQKKNWPCKLDRQAAIQTAERVEKKCVLYRVEETWVVRL